MGNYKKTIHADIEFDGDEIKLDMKRLKRKDTLKVIPLLGEPNEEGEYVVTDPLKNLELMDAMTDILINPSRKYFVNFRGLFVENEEVIMKQGKFVDDDNNPSTRNEDLFKDVFEDSYFMPLIGQIIVAMMNGSFMKGEERKKLEAQPENSSVDQVTMTG